MRPLGWISLERHCLGGSCQKKERKERDKPELEKVGDTGFKKNIKRNSARSICFIRLFLAASLFFVEILGYNINNRNFSGGFVLLFAVSVHPLFFPKQRENLFERVAFL